MSSKDLSSRHTATLLCCIALGVILSQFFGSSTSQALSEWASDYTPWGEQEFVCEKPAYTLRMISYEPFVAHLENFITPNEAAYLKHLAEPNLYPSKVHYNKKRGNVLSPTRTSQSAIYNKNDSVVRCVAQRASEVQGHLALDEINMQATVYKTGEFYKEHHDCGAQQTINKTGSTFRVSTIFGILEANCENCGTNFPYLNIDRKGLDRGICNFIECDRNHLTVKARTGSALFWRNRLFDGTQDNRMIHEGLPLMNGTKFGLNIWSHGGQKAL